MWLLLLIFYFFCAKEKRTLPSECIDGCNVPCVSGQREPHLPTSHTVVSRTAPITCPELLWIYSSRTENRTVFSASPEGTILAPFLIVFVPLPNAHQLSHFRLSGLFSQHFFLPQLLLCILSLIQPKQNNNKKELCWCVKVKWFCALSSLLLSPTNT